MRTIEENTPEAVRMFVAALLDRFLPQKHAEMRPPRAWLIPAIIAAAIAVIPFMGWLAAPPDEKGGPFFWLLLLLAMAAGFVAAYLRYSIHFRSQGVYTYRFGRPYQMEPYIGFRSVEQGYWTPIKLMRIDGAEYALPAADDPEVYAQVLWRLRKAGLPIDGMDAILKRADLKSIDSGSLERFRKLRNAIKRGNLRGGY